MMEFQREVRRSFGTPEELTRKARRRLGRKWRWI
jgi:hypothetical protein